MAGFVKLTRAAKPGGEVWVNLDRVLWMRRFGASGPTVYSPALPDHTRMYLGGSTDDEPLGDHQEVLETPEQILALADPDGSAYARRQGS